MTKYILHGGSTRDKTTGNKNFFKESTKNLPNKADILCIYFANPQKLWKEKFRQDIDNFSNNKKNTHIRCCKQTESREKKNTPRSKKLTHTYNTHTYTPAATMTTTRFTVLPTD